MLKGRTSSHSDGLGITDAPLLDPALKRPGVRSALLLILPFVIALAALAGAVVASRVANIPVSVLTRDPVTSLDGPFYTGWVSALGAVLWFGAASVCLFGAALLSGRGESHSALFLLASGLLTAMLGADDLFLIHDGLMPHALHVGERVVLAGYAGLLLTFLFVFRRELLGASPGPLVAALLFFGMSLLVDKGFIPVPENDRHLAEDGAKLLGIAGWFAFFVRTTFKYAAPQQDSRAAGDGPDVPAPHSATGFASAHRTVTSGDAATPASVPAGLALPPPRQVAAVAWLAAIALLTAHVAGQSIKFLVRDGVGHGIIDRLDMNGEANVPAWYAAALLVLSAVATAAIGFHAKARGAARAAGYWLGLAAMLAFLSLDEATQLHEKLIPPLRRLLGGRGVLFYPWVVPAAALVALVALVYRPLLGTLPPSTRRALLVAGAVYVSGALGMELVSGWHASRSGEQNLTYAMLVAVEEFAELSGLTLLLLALLRHARGAEIAPSDGPVPAASAASH